MVKPDITSLDLETLMALRGEIDTKIDALKQDAAAALRAHLEHESERLGMPITQILNGTNRRSRRSRAQATDTEASS